ncbi:MAG TPA: PadR family transcriptional regulator [Candidatus Saccharimonadales bacterium]|nr:PadR family transcriptional regulator [Candidatus Saccharimonadales bacterium]
MDTQLKKGLLDVCVLKLLSGADSYGYKIISDLSQFVEISESALYAILKRLEQQQLVTTYKEEHDNRLRKYYHLTDAGTARLQEFRPEFAKIERIFQFVLKEDNKV